MTGPWFLYLDESGDLGFDLSKLGRSRYFTICLLAVSGQTRNKAISKAVEKTIRRKLNPKGKRRRLVSELKGTRTSPAVKEYFYRQIAGIHFGIYALTLNKERVYPELQENKDRLYNYLARLILDQIPFGEAGDAVNLFIDRSKAQPEIREFDGYLRRQLESKFKPNVPLYIKHRDSQANKGLQAVDMFCYGFYRKYEMGDESWCRVFRSKIRLDDVYLPPK